MVGFVIFPSDVDALVRCASRWSSEVEALCLGSFEERVILFGGKTFDFDRGTAAHTLLFLVKKWGHPHLKCKNWGIRMVDLYYFVESASVIPA